MLYAIGKAVTSLLVVGLLGFACYDVVRGNKQDAILGIVIAIVLKQDL